MRFTNPPIIVFCNAEGDLISLVQGIEQKQIGEYFIDAYLKDGTGRIYTPLDIEVFRMYLNSEITINDVFLSNQQLSYYRKTRRGNQNLIPLTFQDVQLDIIGNLQCGNRLYNLASCKCEGSDVAFNEMFPI